MKSEIHIYRHGEPVAVIDEAHPCRTWHVGDELRVYQAGVCVATIPREQWVELIYKLTQSLR